MRRRGAFSRIPVFVHIAGWEVYAAYLEFLDTDDMDRLRDAITDLGDTLLRDPKSLAYAPESVVRKYFDEVGS
jgi:hypothetical protein